MTATNIPLLRSASAQLPLGTGTGSLAANATEPQSEGIIRAMGEAFARVFGAKKSDSGNDSDDTKASKAQSDDDDDKDKKDKKDGKGKKAEEKTDEGEETSAAAADDDDGDKKDDKDSKAKGARARERGRIAAIMGCPAAQANPAGALRLAMHTTMPRMEAISLLEAFAPAQAAIQPAPKVDTLRDRMAVTPQPEVKADTTGGERPTMATADFIIMAGRKRRGEVAA
jgi:hypothetical protein